LRVFLAVAAVAAAGAWSSPAGAAAQPRVLAVHFEADVNPVTQEWLNGRIDHAAKAGYDAVVIVLDTPGGLSESMRKIVKKELASPIPVIVYVSPPGARAASAGVWIGQAAGLLAMAPETNIGSSTPISSGGQDIQKDLRRKVINDAAASLRSLAKYRGRNVRWADRAVREASNLTADEALRMNVIDMIAPNLPTLLRKAGGYRIVPDGPTLHLAGAQIDESSPGFLTRFLSTLIDPNIISLLFLAGIAGIGYEIFHPGVVLPGALGAVSLVTALYGFSVLPVSWSGLLLLVLGIGLLVIDAHVVSHGALTVSGLISLAVGMTMLFHNAPAPYETSVPLVVTISVVLGLFWAVAIAKAVQVRRRPVSVGPQTIVGERGEVRRPGYVFVHGELWRARSDEPLEPGDAVEVEGIEEGLVLDVRKA
jgi:membrane-bound serine protease (ClpP class)